MVYSSYFVIVHGNWSVWKLGECSRTCGGGILNYARVCNNPAPSCGGKGCDGLDVYSPKKKCNDICCPGMYVGILVTYVHSSSGAFYQA